MEVTLTLILTIIFGVVVLCQDQNSLLETSTNTIQLGDFLKNKDPDPIVVHTELASSQLPGFNSSQINSGPIILVNSLTLFIPNVNFDTQGRDCAFYVGENCDQLIQTINVENFYWSDVHVNFPDTKTVQDVRKLCVKCEDEIVDSVGIDVSWNVEDFNEKTENTEILRLPKCCPMGESYQNETCSPKSTSMELKIGILDHNETHVNDDPMNVSLFTVIPYFYDKYQGPCDFRILLSREDDDVFNILHNGSLIYSMPNGDCGIMPQGGYCIESNGTDTQVFKCYVPVPVVAAISNTIYIILLSISTLCYGIVAVLYYFWLYNKKAIHRRIFTIYAALMCWNSLFLIFIYCWPGFFCSWFVFLVQFLLITSFYWVAVLCGDVLWQIYHLKDEDENPNFRLSVYSGIGIIVGLFFTLLSFFIYGEPNLPSGVIRVVHSGECAIQEHNIWLFTIPSSICLVASLVALVILKLKIIQNNKDVELQTDIDWVSNKLRYNFVWRQCLIVFIIVTIGLISVVLTDYLSPSIGIAFQIINSLQGVFVLLITITHSYACPHHSHEDKHEMKPLNDVEPYSS